MNTPWIYYKEQCNYCAQRGKCEYEKRTCAFVNALNEFERLVTGVYGSLSFKCDYFNFDQKAYNKDNPPECAG